MMENQPKRRGRKKKGETNGAVDQRSEAPAPTPTPTGQGSNGDDSLIGSYVTKDPSSGTGRPLLGKVVSFDAATGLLRVVYEDGEGDDLETAQVRKIILVEDRASGMKMSVRKRKLDQLAPSAAASMPPPTPRAKVSVPEIQDSPARVADLGSALAPNVSAPEYASTDPPLPPPMVSAPKVEDALEAPSLPSKAAPDASQVSSHSDHLPMDPSECADSPSNSCDDMGSSLEQDIEMPTLPPSSGDIGVPEGLAADLFSVYNFLRSFSLQLYLSPFGLHDFVGALNSTVQNSLLDAVYLSLMRALRRHLEALSSEGSKPALKCLRQYDWSLLDALTWPVFLIEYLYIMGYMKGLDVDGFGVIATEGEYYGLPVATKLKVLQILCDDIIDSAEIRVELEMRERAEDEKESNSGAGIPPDHRPMRVHPRYSKTSAWKDTESMKISKETSKLGPLSIIKKPGEEAADGPLDANNDECQLCGMDGTLICCDGCPLAYHSRCIGLNKANLPDGVWFCPECAINKLGPANSKIGRGTRGAEVLGLDMFGRLFLGTCNYLLIIGTSLDAEPVSRYYNQGDIAKVLSVICSKEESFSAYRDICWGISKHWEIPFVDSQTGEIEPISRPQKDKEHVIDYRSTSALITSSTVFSIIEGENQVNNTTESSSDNKLILPQNDNKSIHDLSAKKTPIAAAGTSFLPKTEQVTLEDVTETKHHADASVMTSMSRPSQPKNSVVSTAVDVATFASKTEIGREGTNFFSEKTNSTSTFNNESKLGRPLSGEKNIGISNTCAITPASFKPQAYMNQYILGDVAASAAANLAVLASEKSKNLETNASTNPRKAMSASIALQIKAFSGATVHFLWPSHEKKLLEVPRERCGWCIACKAAGTYKKGCFLNSVASNAIKGSARNVTGFRPIKNEASHLPVIATHIANMEETLHGLIIGPFLDAEYNQQWRKQVKKVSSCWSLKFLLLELEKNIREIAFSGDWIQLVDDWAADSSAAPTSASRTGPNQKRGYGGRRSKKQSVASDFLQGSSTNSEKDMEWWRGDKVSKVVFQKGALPSSLVKKAARQGGCRMIPGISYPDGSEFPRRNQQFVWRASVELCRNASQLALQVRRLDAHLRWRDLVPPDQTLEGKGSVSDASVFRNAVICDKKIVANKILYALNFANQKHLPLRVTKNILETENKLDDNGKLWFSENHVPLYLIKDFEEKIGAKPSPSSVVLFSDYSWKYQRKQLQSRRREIFLYLLHKGERLNKCSCVSCKRDVFLRDAVKCSSCQDYCHKDCTRPTTVGQGDDLEFVFMCNACYCTKSAVKKPMVILNSPFSSLGLDKKAATTAYMLPSGSHQAAHRVEAKSHQIVESINTHQEMGSFLGSASEKKAKRGSSSRSYGLIWKKRKDDNEFGSDFRLENIILKSREGMDPSRKPECCLCKKPYRSDLMYIRCEHCQRWYHGDALNLEEAQIFDLLGFKCCKCRRIASPKCPYMDPNYRKPAMGTLKRGHARSNGEPLSNGEATSKRQKLSHCTTALESGSEVDDVAMVEDEPLQSLGVLEPFDQTLSHPNVEDAVVVGDDPLLHSLGTVEPIEQIRETESPPGGPEPMSQGQQKMTVRRPQIKHEMGTDTCYRTQDIYSRFTAFSDNLQDPYATGDVPSFGLGSKEFSTMEEEDFMDASENSQTRWDYEELCRQGDGNEEDSDFKDQLHDLEIGGNLAEYEPQTYFSVTELFPSDEGQFDNQDDAQENWYPSTNFDDFGPSYENLPHDQLEAHAMGSIEEYPAPANEPGFHGVACDICKTSQPSPDLKCEACGLCLHSNCSPWVESENLPWDDHWRCGDCRSWR